MTPPPAVPLPDIAACRVLVVDDNAINCELLVALLERARLSCIETATDGLEALAAIERFRPDLVLLDLMMPRLDGYEVCRRLRADARHADLPVLVQTSLTRPEDRARAFAAGATDFVTKPLNAAELEARVRIHLQNRVLIRNLRQYRERTASELVLARSMQRRLLPGPAAIAAMAAAGLRLGAHFEPSSELGGDLWGLRHDDRGRPVLYLADFSGHGVAAALNTFRLHAILRGMDFADFEPARFLADLNRRLCPLLPDGQFATMLIGVVDAAAGVFRYASAASTAPLLLAEGGLRFGDGSGLPLGIVPEVAYDDRSLPLAPGSRLLLYSDAAIEVETGRGVLGEDGFAGLAAAAFAGPAPLPDLVARLQTAGTIDDDLTLLVLERPPGGTGPGAP
ncbi:MAG TPA: SpoIIE family protein phosphatase [Alphaproteobacteria bacterium]|nr:SpoIIE family protein phosphatase [Alphaproteobacteria bacterium]